MGSAASATSAQHGASASSPCAKPVYFMETDDTDGYPIRATVQAEPQEQPNRVFAFDAEEWEAAFGKTCRELQAKYGPQESPQDHPVERLKLGAEASIAQLNTTTFIQSVGSAESQACDSGR
eukprot:CAMPEP_0114682052 /NCGR_PEP_ID=MMETSP0191-20121206/56071_1 /TAXON_ID=126664 /ORGANISM="Sorites sp." /LENGTH=121 /DNA_ID=CAMNT_0001961107 /DNA_START=41 /DNA_END=406 /DNA_ORIENTATION=+